MIERSPLILKTIQLDKQKGDIKILLQEISQEEVNIILKKKKNTAPHPDNIRYIALQRGPPILIEVLLTEVYNALLKLGDNPRSAKLHITYSY